MLAQKRHLAARRIIFRQPRDLIEQHRPRRVVEVFRRQPFRLGGQAGENVGGEWLERRGYGRRAEHALRTRGHGAAQRPLKFGEPQAAELPARRRIEEIAIGRPRMTVRRRQRRAAQYHLIDHELAIVFAERTGLGLITGIRRIGAAGPLPHLPNASSSAPARAATSHSASLGRCLPAQRAKASAS